MLYNLIHCLLNSVVRFKELWRGLLGGVRSMLCLLQSNRLGESLCGLCITSSRVKRRTLRQSTEQWKNNGRMMDLLHAFQNNCMIFDGYLILLRNSRRRSGNNRRVTTFLHFDQSFANATTSLRRFPDMALYRQLSVCLDIRSGIERDPS